MKNMLAYLVPLLLAVTLYVNGIAASGALNGIDTGAISDKYPTLFTPASYVFSIWSIIYLGLIGFGIFQLLPAQLSGKSLLPKTRTLFLVNLILNASWIVVWQYEYIFLSVPIMLGLLATLILIYEHEGIGRRSVSGWYRALVHAPFSLYLGWISVATIANISVYLYSIGWNGWGISDVSWTIVMMAVATLLGLVLLIKKRDYIFAGVIAWALVGIGVKQQLVFVIPLAATLGVILLIAVGLYRKYVRSSYD